MPNIIRQIYRYVTVTAVIVSSLLVLITTVPLLVSNDAQAVTVHQTMPQSQSPQTISKPKSVKKKTTQPGDQNKAAQLDKEVIVSRVANNDRIKLSKKDYQVLTRIVEAEATGGDIKSKTMVANVILNRVSHAQFPNTIRGVVFQRNGGVTQFSPISDGRYYKVSVTKATKQAVNQALAGTDYSKGALFFVSRAGATKKNLDWFDNQLKPLFYYGGHEFYTTK